MIKQFWTLQLQNLQILRTVLQIMSTFTVVSNTHNGTLLTTRQKFTHTERTQLVSMYTIQNVPYEKDEVIQLRRLRFIISHCICSIDAVTHLEQSSPTVYTLISSYKTTPHRGMILYGLTCHSTHLNTETFYYKNAKKFGKIYVLQTQTHLPDSSRSTSQKQSALCTTININK